MTGDRPDAHPRGSHGEHIAETTWIDLVDPARGDLAALKTRFGLENLAIDDALSVRQRPKLDEFDSHGLLVLKTVSFTEQDLTPHIGEVFVFFASDFVVTATRGPENPVERARRTLAVPNDPAAPGTTAIVHTILDELVDQYLTVISRIATDVRDIEDAVFDDDVPADSQDMYRVKREIIEIRRAVQPLVGPLTTLASGTARHIDQSYRYEFSDVRDHLLKVMDEIDVMERIMDAALQANLSLMTVQQNEDMRKISAWVGIAAVPTMVAGIYGMNFEHMPELGTRFGYFVVLGIVTSTCLLLFRAFRKNNWL